MWLQHGGFNIDTAYEKTLICSLVLYLQCLLYFNYVLHFPFRRLLIITFLKILYYSTVYIYSLNEFSYLLLNVSSFGAFDLSASRLRLR